MDGMNNNNNNITEEEFAYSQEVLKKLSDYFENKVVGQAQLKFSLVVAIVADGQFLL